MAMRIIVCLLGLLLSYGYATTSFMREYNFSTSALESAWKARGDKNGCELSHLITGYGEVTFKTTPGRATMLIWNNWQGISSATRAVMWARPPVWQHGLEMRRLGNYTLRAGNMMLQLPAKATQDVLSALSSGYFIRLVYIIKIVGEERITVDVSPVNWQTGFIKYNQCLKTLLPFHFEDIRLMDVFFESNSEDITLEQRRKLNRIIRYIKAGAKFRKIVLKGYTDNTGDYNHNRRLAGRRAEAVKGFLLHHGINPGRIEIIDIFGKYRLVNKGWRGRRVNVEIKQ